MSALIAVEGTRFKAKMIPRARVVSIWKALTKRPFPKVAAFQLKDSDFDRAMQLMKCKDDERREKREWGRVLSTKGTDACVYSADETADVDYVILIRENPYHSLQEVLKHELSHIAGGDLQTRAPP
jgi:hypothetical protein